MQTNPAQWPSIVLWVAVLAGGLSAAQPVHAAEPVVPTGPAIDLGERVVSIPRAIDRSCSERATAAPGRVGVRFNAPVTGVLRARLDAARGDWDLAVFEARGGRLVAAAASAGRAEIAEGILVAPGDVIVRACRVAGPARQARISAEITPVTGDARPPASLVAVRTDGREERNRLASLGLDLTEHGRADRLEIVAHGPGDLELLSREGFDYEVRVPDLARLSASQRREDVGFRRATARSSLPSGRTTYRRLNDYSQELKDLARRYPKLVRHFTLPFATYEGRPMEGIEIARNVRRKTDGRPAFLMMGLHHAREWPSGEHTIEWAHQLLRGHRRAARNYRRLLAGTRALIVPVVNPDGFNASREAGQLLGAGDGRGGGADAETANILLHPNEYRRKNCRFLPPLESAGGSCGQISLGYQEAGVDLNRNYGGLWGGPGASAMPTATDYRGPGPFSEPETRNIKHLVSHHQVTVLITNHTYANLVLRPPGLAAQGVTPDEDVYRRLGRAMARESGYLNQVAHKFYDTTGATDDWSYYATGGFGFTLEIGPHHFHPPFADVVAEWVGSTPAAALREGAGNRRAFLIAQRFAAHPRHHAVIRGRAPAGARLTLEKSFRTKTSPVISTGGATGEAFALDERLRTRLRVPRSGRFRWSVNPSTRPILERGRTERWKLRCRSASGSKGARRGVFIERGQVRRLDLRRACRR